MTTYEVLEELGKVIKTIFLCEYLEKEEPRREIHERIKKILKVDYPRGRAKGYYANFISAQKLKIEFSLFTPLSSLNCAMTSPLKFRGEYMEPRGIASRNSFD